MSKKLTLEEFQETIDNVYGKGEWTILNYDGGEKSCSLIHKCGKRKVVERAKYVRTGKASCPCKPITDVRKKYYDNIKVTKEEFQQTIDDIYGEGVWTILEFDGMAKPLTIEHSCGEPKTITRATNMKKGTCRCICEAGRYW